MRRLGLFLFLLAALLLGSAPCRAGDAWAVIVGINDYGDSARNLTCAENDAKRFDALMTKYTPASHVRLLTTDAGAPDGRPTGANVAAALQALSKKAGPDNSFWFFFSGHGEDKDGAHYLLPSDFKLEDLAHSALDLKQVRALLATGCRAGRKVMIVDACHSGLDDAASYGETAATNQSLPLLLTACRADQYAYELKSLKEGVYSYYLLQQLENSAGARGLTVPDESLTDAVGSAVATCVRRANKPTPQTPRVFGTPPTGGLLASAVVLDPPQADADAMEARPPLGPGVVIDLPDARTLLDGQTVPSDFVESALRRKLLEESFPLVDPKAARQLDALKDRQQAAQKARQLGAKFLVRGRAETSSAKLEIAAGFITVQATITAELVDDSGRVLAQFVVPGGAEDTIAASRVTEVGAAKIALGEAEQELADQLLPKLRQALKDAGAAPPPAPAP